MSQHSLSLQICSSQDCQDQIFPKIKLKTLQVRLITDLSKTQKYQSRIYFDLQSKKKKRGVKSPKQQCLKVSKKTLKQISQQIKNNDKRSKGKYKVKFSQGNKLQEITRRPSIDKSLDSFNFRECIKRMAVQLTQSKKSQSSSGQLSIQQKSSRSLLCGYTEKQFNDGTVFKGVCERGVMIKGQLYFKNGFIYKGQLFLDKFHGQGQLFLPKGQVIKGQWNDGQIIGKAQINYPKGQIYYGDLKNYRRHGKGFLFFKDQSKYQGQFTQGELTGHGIYTSNEGVQTQGYWFYGDYIGQNQQVFQNIINNNSMIEKKKLEKMKDKKFVLTLLKKQNIAGFF